MGICCMAQETQTTCINLEALYQPRGGGMGREMRGSFKREGEYMYTYGWFTLRFDRKQQTSVKQLYFNKKKINNYKKKKRIPEWFAVSSTHTLILINTLSVSQYRSLLNYFFKEDENQGPASSHPHPPTIVYMYYYQP